MTHLEAPFNRRTLQGFKHQFGYVRRKTQNAKRLELRIRTKRRETSARKALNTAHKQISQDVQTLIMA